MQWSIKSLKNYREGDEDDFWEEGAKVASILKYSVVPTELHQQEKTRSALSG